MAETMRATADMLLQAAETRRERVRRRIGILALAYLLVLVLTFLMIAPFTHAAISSFKDNPTEWPPKLLPSTWHPENYLEAWTLSKTNTGVPLFPLWVRNTLLVAAVKTASVVLFSAMAGYAFARLNFPLKNFLFYLTLFVMMVPSQVTFISNYILLSRMRLVNTYIGLALVELVTPAGVFLMTQFLKSLPKELEEAAVIDGASRLQTFTRIIIPLSKPALGALTILNFQGFWNAFFWPTVLLRHQELFTLPLGLDRFNRIYGNVAGRADLILAGSIMSALPIIIIFLVFQRYFIEGVSLSGLKG
ncbi:MAG: carbohydrate ABC transporter permease [Deinococcus sp.]|nr:carbohydrate ABC transporter permease [Deinococcus sp.]